MKGKKPTEKKVTYEDVMKKHDAVISMSIKEGFVNVTFHRGEFEVSFFDDEGCTLLNDYDDKLSFETIDKITKFINDLKSIKLKD
jgi:hypothetical protein